MAETKTLEQGIGFTATLFLVPHGTDREDAGRALAAPLLGEGRRAEGLVRRGVHPDLIELLPPVGKEKIGIDQVRDVVRRGQFAAVQARCKVCLIPHAEALTPEAENALLKVLEEPAGDLVFLLLAEHPADVLPTILSRSQVVRLPPRSPDAVLEQLSQMGYGEEESRYLVAAARREEEMAEFLARREDVIGERERSSQEAKGANARRLAEMVTSSLPIERHEAVLSLLERLVGGEPGLRVGAARAVAQASREEVGRFLDDLFFRTFELVRAGLSSSEASSDPPVWDFARTLDQKSVLAYAEAIRRAQQAVETYTPAEAVLLSLFVRAGELRRG